MINKAYENWKVEKGKDFDNKDDIKIPPGLFKDWGDSIYK